MALVRFVLVLLFCGCCFSGCATFQVSLEERVSLPIYEPKKPVEIALVLGGGGARGLAHLGAIQELEEAGIRPDLIVGCSAGAMAGALYADKQELGETAQTLIALRKKDVLDYSFINPVLGLVHGDLLQNLMRTLLEAKTFEELKIPLIVVATDLITGDPIEISSGELSSAIRASCAFPGMFKPVLLYGRYCVDGGAVNPVPVDIAKRYGAKVIIAIDLSEKLPKDTPRHLVGITKRSLEIVYRRFVENSLALADIAIRMNFDDVGTFTDDLNGWFYEQGRCAVRDKLPEIQDKIALHRKSDLHKKRL